MNWEGEDIAVNRRKSEVRNSHNNELHVCPIMVEKGKEHIGFCSDWTEDNQTDLHLLPVHSGTHDL